MLCLVSCSDVWDDHYDGKGNFGTDAEVEVVNMTTAEYLQSDTELSSLYKLLTDTKLFSKLNSAEQLSTLVAVPDGDMKMDKTRADGAEVDEETLYKAESYVSDAFLSPVNITDGQRLLMWNGKYIQISIVDGKTSFNKAPVKKIIKTTNGYIYKLASDLVVPKSLYETISMLGDKYSRFRDMILSRNEKVFDEEKSIPIGVDNTGATVYDSVFTVRNPYFEQRGFNIMSEANNATLFIPSNDLVDAALSQAKANLKAWHMERADSVLENWIFQSAIFNERYTPEDLTDPEQIDFKSALGKQWRITVNTVDTSNPIEMSNGLAYYVTELKIPTNVLIYRLKDFFYHYADISAADQERFFKLDNLDFLQVKEAVAPWSGWPGVFPKISNIILRFQLADAMSENPSGAFTFDFTPFRYQVDGTGYKVDEYLVPPGEYEFFIGCEQKVGYDLEVYFNDVFQKKITKSEFTKSTFHYDRGGGGYPEGYDTKKATDKKKSNYDRDGGKVGTVTITGTEAKPVKITFKSTRATGGKQIFHHWCLKPTSNCY